MCNPTCDKLADVRIPEKRNQSGWKLTFDDLRYAGFRASRDDNTVCAFFPVAGISIVHGVR